MAVGDTNLQSCTITLKIAAVLNKELDLSTPDDTLSISDVVKLSDGTGAENGNQMWHDTRTLATGASENLDLAGVLTNAFGDTVTFAKIRVVYIRNNSTASSLLVGGAASNAWFPFLVDSSDKIKLQPKSTNYVSDFVMTAPGTAGFAVTAGSADQLKIEHGAEASASLTYTIVLIGENA